MQYSPRKTFQMRYSPAKIFSRCGTPPELLFRCGTPRESEVSPAVYVTLKLFSHAVLPPKNLSNAVLPGQNIFQMRYSTQNIFRCGTLRLIFFRPFLQYSYSCKIKAVWKLGEEAQVKYPNLRREI